MRFHALLSDEMGTLVREMNKNIYSFFNADQVMEFLVSIGMRPFVELSFMPETLASGFDQVFQLPGERHSAKNYRQWKQLIHKLASLLGQASTRPGEVRKMVF